jgi:NADH:ubiquinone oxidoreductase subunit 2 (subunit N)
LFLEKIKKKDKEGFEIYLLIVIWLLALIWYSESPEEITTFCFLTLSPLVLYFATPFLKPPKC